MEGFNPKTDGLVTTIPHQPSELPIVSPERSLSLAVSDVAAGLRDGIGKAPTILPSVMHDVLSTQNGPDKPPVLTLDGSRVALCVNAMESLGCGSSLKKLGPWRLGLWFLQPGPTPIHSLLPG